jgi:hypothetical protein
VYAQRPGGSKSSTGGSIDRTVVADSHHFHDKRDPDPHVSEKLDPDLKLRGCGSATLIKRLTKVHD